MGNATYHKAERQGNAVITRARRNHVQQKVVDAGPKGISTREIMKLLEDEAEEFRVDDRTVQRDVLHILSDERFEIVPGQTPRRLRLKPKARRPDSDTAVAPLKADPKLLKSARVALGIVTLYEQASHLLHRSALEDLREHYQNSKDLLRKHYPHESRWIGKVVMSSQHLQLIQAKFEDSCLHEVQLALLGGYQLEIRYYSQSSAEEKTQVINPLGISYQDASVYVICTYENNETVRTLPLQRFRQIRSLPHRDVHVPVDFELQNYTQRLVEPEKITLKLLIDRVMRVRLDPSETPMAENQRITPVDEEWSLLECEVAWTQGLTWWVLAHAEKIQVLEPVELRQKVATRLSRAAGYYAND